MKMILSRRRRAMLALDLILILMELYALTVSWMESGLKLFRYYTQDSNILALIACILCLAQNLSCIRRGAGMPGWTRKLRYMAASCLMMTLLVSAFLLTPVEGSFCLFEDEVDADAARELVNAGVAVCTGACGVFMGSDETGYRYVIGSRHIDLRAEAKRINQAISGRGGGKSMMIEGSCTATAEQLKAFFAGFDGAAHAGE